MPVALAFSDDMPELQALINTKRDEWQRVARDIATDAGAMGELVMKGQIIKSGIVGGTGWMLNQVTSSVGLEGEAVITWIRTEAVYGPVMDEGRRPYPNDKSKWPPYAPMIKWAQRKFGVTGKAAVSAGIAVSKHIGRHGIKGRKYVDKTAKILTKRLPKLIDTRLAEFVNRDR